jgi:hypothetical protein
MDNFLESYIINLNNYLDSNITLFHNRKKGAITEVERISYDFNLQVLQSYRSLVFGKALEVK